MIWLTLRQHRVVLAVSAAVVAAFVIWMFLVEHDYSGAARAIAKSCASSNFYALNSPCTAHYSAESSAWNQADIIRWLLLLVPLMFGVLLGAPLFAGEFERKTVILAFTQNISRTRWMVIRWLVIGLPVVVLSVVLALVSNWWFLRVPTNGGSFAYRIQPGSGFDVTGIVPAAYALFAFALGAALGMALRRTSQAIFGTFVLFTAARYLFEHYARGLLATPIFSPATVFTSGFSFSTPRKAWQMGTAYRFRPGTHLTSHVSINQIVSVCGNPYGDDTACLTKHGIQVGVLYQPESHFWALQWGETGCFVAAAALLFGLALWSLRRWRA
jgi:hypothetical protein